jgi:hypothetical protein
MEHSKGIIVIFHNGERFVHLIFDVSMNPSDISIYASRKIYVFPDIPNLQQQYFN